MSSDAASPFEPAVEIDAPALRRLAGHSRRPEFRAKETADDRGDLPDPPHFAEQLREDERVVRVLVPPDGIRITPSQTCTFRTPPSASHGLA